MSDGSIEIIVKAPDTFVLRCDGTFDDWTVHYDDPEVADHAVAHYSNGTMADLRISLAFERTRHGRIAVLKSDEAAKFRRDAERWGWQIHECSRYSQMLKLKRELGWTNRKELVP